MNTIDNVRSELVLMTPEKARHLRDTAHFERQRDIYRRNVERLAAEMKAGRFIEGTQIYICVFPDGWQQIANGNHTLEAIVASGKPMLLDVVYRNVSTLDEVGEIYARFDIQRVRNYRDALRAHGVDTIVGDSGWSSAFGGAVVYMIGRFTHSGSYSDVELSTSRDIRIQLMRDASDYASLYVAACSPAARTDKRIFKRVSAMGVGIELFRYQPSGADEFFGGMARDDGLRAGTPEHTLLKYLRNNASKGESDRFEHTRAVALAWNAWFRRRGLEYVKPNQMGEFRLLGTPWKDGFDPVKAYLPDIAAAREAGKSPQPKSPRSPIVVHQKTPSRPSSLGL